MAHEQAREFVEQAVQAIQTAQYPQAAELLQRAISLDPDDSEAFILQGVTLSQLRRPNEATDAFRRAIQLSPSNSKAFYNLAVHYFSLNEKERSLEMAREALRVDPGNTQARDLVERLQTELGVGPSADVPAPPPPAGSSSEQPFGQPAAGYGVPPAPPTAGYYRAGYYDYSQPVHSLRFIERMGSWWDGVGWAISGGFFITWLASLLITLPFLQEVFSNPNSPALRNMRGNMFVGPNPLLSVAYDILVLGIIVWMILDLLDRRGNWLWMLPTTLACCCLGINWLIPPIYILFGRPRA